MLDITMPRGDIRHFKIAIRNPSGQITDIVFDDVFFTVKKIYMNIEYTFQKRLSNGSIVKDQEDGLFYFSIMPEDTNSLPFGAYDFDIEIVKGTTIKQTTIGQLQLTPEVTFQTNEV